MAADSVIPLSVLMNGSRFRDPVNPCASIIASVQPSRQEASSSSARRRSGLGLRLRLGVGRKTIASTSARILDLLIAGDRRR